MGMAAAVMIWIHYRMWIHLPLNYGLKGSDMYSSLGFANQITLARGWGISLIAGFIPLQAAAGAKVFYQIAWLASVVYLMAAVADFADGFWARRTGTETEFGRQMDTELDALGLLVASVLAVRLGHLPNFYLIVSLSYYIFRFGVRHRQRCQKAVHSLTDSTFRRQIAGIQMGFVGAGLLPVFNPLALRVAAVCFMLPFLAGFLWDWKEVKGGLTERAKEKVTLLFNRIEVILPLFLRLLLLIGGLLAFKALLPAEMLKWPFIWWGLWFCLVVGVMGRLCACAASVFLAFQPGFAEDLLTFAAFMSCTTGIVMFGSGKWSLWQPENRLFTGKLGTLCADASRNKPQAVSR
jgi:CDP-diacylglycerol--glycerol-3-phosphate 3-phosphatidyltransferase